jgi:hypothetical protein
VRAVTAANCQYKHFETFPTDHYTVNSIDELVRNLLKYARRPEWETRLSDVWHEHIEEAAKQMHISPDELANLVDEEGWHDALFGVVFEDFATRRAQNEPSFAEVYLKRAGWREAPAARRYLEAMASSRLGLYEIVEVQRDRGLVLSDLLQEGPSVFVHEKSATHSALRWDVIAARVVSLLEKQVLTGGILRFYRDSAERLIESLTKPQAPVTAVSMERLPLSVTTAWLADAVERHKHPLPELSNTDGEPLLFGESRLPLHAPAAEITSRLDAAPDWERAGDSPPVWNWSGGAPAAVKSSGKGMRLGSFAPSGEPLRGTVELKGSHLLFTTNSRERMERGLARLSVLLDGAIGKPVTSYQSAEAVMASPNRAEQQPPEDIPAAELAAIKLEFLDQHYRETLRSRIPALGDKTPRQALRTENGRQRVIAWLKYLENGEARRAAHTGDAPYDFSWMWKELGLAHERHD